MITRLEDLVIDSNSEETEIFLKMPGLLNFLPMLYIAWADDILTPSEINTIKGIVNKQVWLKTEEKDKLSQWLNPALPPSPKQMKSWLSIMEVVSDQIPESSKKSLVDIGFQIAKIGSDDDFARCSTPEACKALYEMENVLGILSEESYRDLFEKETPKKEVEPLPGGSFDYKEMARWLDSDNGAIIQRVKTLLSDPVFSYLGNVSHETYREKILEWCKILARQGIGALAYPKQYGGKDDVASYFAAMETLGFHDLSLLVKFGVQFGLFGMSIYLLGTEKHHKKYLKDVANLNLPGCFAMTETGHGSNVRDIETIANYDKATGEFIIHTPSDNARKDYIGNAAMHGQMATVFAQLNIDGIGYGVSPFLVPIRNKNGDNLPGVVTEDCGEKMGLNGVDNGRIWFDKVRIPRENLLDRFCQVDKNGEYSSPISSDSKRFFTMLATLVGGRIGIPRAGLSAAKTGLTIAIRYASRRRQFGPANRPETLLLDYQTHQKRLFPLIANTYALHFALQYLTNRYINETDEDSREIEALAAGLKAYATWKTTNILQICREACGGSGYLTENRLGTLKADTDIFTTFEGDNTVLMQLVAKGLLSGFQHQFHDINFFGLVKYIANKAGTAISELNPIIVRSTDEDHLLDPEFHLNAFKYREQILLVSCAKRLKKYIDRGQNSYDAFIRCQDHMVNLAESYIERFVLEQFIATVNSCEAGPIRNILKKLCDLYALSTIEKQKGWYLENGYLEGVKSKAIKKLVRKLCYKMRNDALPLVDAFEIPNQCLSAPIAL